MTVTDRSALRFSVAVALVVATSSGCPASLPGAPVSPLPSEQCRAQGADGAAFEVASHQVFGRVLGNLEDLLQTSGYIEFIDKNTGARNDGDLRDGRFSIMLPSGVYDVAIHGTFGNGYYNTNNKRMIAKDLRINANTNDLVLDAALVTRDIELTYGGEAFPQDEISRGHLILTGIDFDDSFRLEIPIGGNAKFRVAFPADGSYEVKWQRRRFGPVSELDDAASARLPLGIVELQPIFVSRWTDSMPPLVYDISAETTQLDVELIVDDTDHTGARGTLDLWNAATILFEPLAPVSFSLVLVPGQYDVNLQVLAYDPNRGSYYPYKGYQDAMLCRSESAEDGQCDFEKSTTLIATVEPTLRPTAMFKADITSGTLASAQVQPVRGGLLVLKKTGVPRGGEIVVELDDDGGIALEHGMYDVWYEQLSIVEGAPSGKVLLEAGFPFFEDTRFEKTIVTSSARVEFTRNGVPLPDDALLDGDSRGILSMQAHNATGEEVATITIGDLGEVGPAQYDFEVVNGNYTFVVDTMIDDGAQSRFASQSILPHGQRTVGTHTFGEAALDFVSLNVSVVDVDLNISGLVGDPESGIGIIGFRDRRGDVLGAAGAADMRVALYPDDYDVLYFSDSTSRIDRRWGPGAAFLGSLCVGPSANAFD